MNLHWCAGGRGFRVHVVERRWQRRSRPASAASMEVEETGSNGIDGDGGDRRSSERQRLGEFLDEKQNDTGWATIYRFRNINSGY
jgi:hypothetical protein